MDNTTNTAPRTVCSVKDRYSGGIIWLTMRDGLVVGAMGCEPARYLGLTIEQAQARGRSRAVRS